MAILDLETQHDNGYVRIVLTGELDISSASTVEEELTRLEAEELGLIVLDLRKLDFMDSTGLRLIVSADARARDASRRLVLVRGPEAVQRIFDITRLDERLEIVDDLAAVTVS